MKLNMKEKRPYERPQMQTVELRERPRLLDASRPDYYPEPW